MAEVALGILEFASEIITQYTGIILSINKLKSRSKVIKSYRLE
ncbi:MAG TPA: hypothetical protein VFD03_11515 [Clostridia bacterium]|nr:hypothetical protein [Clostridia bacterium]